MLAKIGPGAQLSEREIKGVKTNKLRALFKSSLALTLIGVFLLVAAIEASFLAVLCIDVLKADESAKHEFEMLQGSAGLSRVIQKAQRVFDAADEARKAIGDTEKEQAYHDRINETMLEMNGVIKRLNQQGLDTKGAENLRNTFAQITRVLEEVMKDAKLNGDIKTSFRAILNRSQDIYGEFVKEIKAVHAALGSKPVDGGPAVFGLAPQKLLYICLGSNFFLALLLLFLVDRSITGPIAKLSKNCDAMMTGEVMPKPGNILNEISVLELSFHEMSLVVSENEKRRYNFLEFFQSVQSAALENVRACFDALLAESNLQEKARKNIEKARNNLATLMQLLQSMTEALSFNSNASIEPRYEKCTTGGLISSASAAVEALLQKRRIVLELKCEEHECSVDPHLISRVLVNFLSNAIKYSPEGASVCVELSSQGNDLRFNVKDSGPGISREDQGKLFKEFSQVKSADGIKRSGTGLGLLICKQIVEAHGGRVGIESEVGRGSCFWFEIPKTQSGRTLSQVPDKTSLPKKEKTGKRGLQRAFVIMLLLMLIPQSLFLMKLHSMFGNVSQKAQSFFVEKEILMRVEELLGLYLVWKLDVAKAVDSMQIGDVAATQPIIDEQIDNAEWIIENTSGMSQTNHEARRTSAGLQKLNKFGQYLGKHQDDLNMAVLPKLMSQARKLAKEVEESLFTMLNLEESGIQNSYDGSVAMRAEIMSALGLAALLNFTLLAVLAGVCLKITEKIALLKSKAEDFAAGRALTRTLSGNDELAYLDRQLCEVAQAIKDADSQRQKLIAVINHDLRTPLTSIINGLQMILAAGYGEIGQKERELTTRAEEELNRLLQQINDLLLIEKIDAGLYQLNAEKFEVIPVLAATTRSFNASASKKGIRLRPEIPNECRNVCVKGDKSLVEREFSIIISNAVNAAPQGSIIDVMIRKDGDELSVSFKDHGAGIDEELLPQIFDRFRYVGGKPLTGLGLPLAHRLSVIHGGRLDIDSSSLGTQTRVTLPIAV